MALSSTLCWICCFYYMTLQGNCIVSMICLFSTVFTYNYHIALHRAMKAFINYILALKIQLKQHISHDL